MANAMSRFTEKSPTIRGSGGRHREKILGFEEVVPGVVNRTDGIRNCQVQPGTVLGKARVSPRIRGSGSRQGSTTTTTYTNNLHQQQLLRRRYQLKS